MLFLCIAGCVYAQLEPSPTATPAGHAPMELFGMGPEMVSNRGLAWVKAISEILTALISTIGVLGLAALAVVQNLRKQAINPEVAARLDRQGARIDQVALAIPTDLAQTVKIAQPSDEPIPVTTEPQKTT